MEETKECLALLKLVVAKQDERIQIIEELLKKSVTQNAQLLHDADTRLDRANTMVLKLTQSVDGLRDLCTDLERQYTHYLDSVCSSRDIAVAENVEMRKELSQMRSFMLSSLKEIASRPTISNSNSKI